jgi:hypothetical protein
MKKTLIFILAFAPLYLFAQLRGQFELVGAAGVFSSVNDSTYRGNINFQADQFADGYLPTQIQIGFFGVDAKGDTYSVVAVNSADFSSANLDLQRDTSTQTAPTGIVLIYKDPGTGLIPSYAVNSTGISPILEARIHRHNANVLKAGNGVDSVTVNINEVTIHTRDTNYTFQLRLPEIGDVWYVATTGVDSLAVKGDISNPLSDPWAAADTATAGDVIIIFPGTYSNADNTRNLWKNGVTMFAFPGTVIGGTPYAETGSTSAFFYPQTNGESMSVFGDVEINGRLITLDSIENIDFVWYGKDQDGVNWDAGAKANNVFIAQKELGPSKPLLFVIAESAGDSCLDNRASFIIDKYDHHFYLVDFSNENSDKLNRNSFYLDIKQTDVPTSVLGQDRGYFADASVSKRFVGWNVTMKVNRGRWRQDGDGGSFDYNVFGGAYYSNASRDNQMVIECNNCSTTGSVRPMGDFYFSGWEIYMRGNYFHNALNDNYPAIKFSNVQSSPTDPGIFYFDANFIVDGAPAVRVNGGTQQGAVFSGNFKRLDESSTGVIDMASGVGGSSRLVGRNLVLEVPAGDTAIVGTGGTFYAAGVYDNTPSFNGLDPDITFTGLPQYASSGLRDALPLGDYTADGGDLYDFRVLNADQISLNANKTVSINSDSSNVQINALQGLMTLGGEEIRIQGDSLNALNAQEDAGIGFSEDDIQQVGVMRPDGLLKFTTRLLPRWDTLTVTAANDTIDLEWHYDNVIFIDMTSAPATVNIEVERGLTFAFMHWIFYGVGSTHTINFTHEDVEGNTPSSFTVGTTGNQKVIIFRKMPGSPNQIWLRNYDSTP